MNLVSLDFKFFKSGNLKTILLYIKYFHENYYIYLIKI